ncbi:MAG: hypothetical protein ACI9W2_004928 [Gammaproteobacteria bacterium]|jgi:hypothetical protein
MIRDRYKYEIKLRLPGLHRERLAMSASIAARQLMLMRMT